MRRANPGDIRKPFPEWKWLAGLAKREAEALIPLTTETADCFDCPKCGEPQMWRKGLLTDLEHPPICDDCVEKKLKAEEDRRLEARRAERLVAAGMPTIYRTGFVAPAVWPVLPNGSPLSSWRGEEPWCLVIYGRSGAGKSFLASALFGSLVTGSRNFATVAEDDELPVRGCWIASALAAERLFSPRSAEFFDRLATCEVLLVDDFGREVSAAAREKLVTILGVRYSYALPTLITTNLPPAGTVDQPGIARLDSALGRRLDTGAWIEMRERWNGPSDEEPRRI